MDPMKELLDFATTYLRGFDRDNPAKRAALVNETHDLVDAAILTNTLAVYEIRAAESTDGNTHEFRFGDILAWRN